MSKDIHKWSNGRYVLMFDEHTFFVFDNVKEKRMTALQTTKRLNEQQATISKLQDLCGESDSENAKLRIENKKLKEMNEQLRQSVEYWQKKYEEGTETFTFPPNCDECDFLGNNGICGYCKFTLNCYDSKEDLEDGEVLPNCPLKPLINEDRQLRKINKQLREINKGLGDDLYNCRLNKNIISEKLKLWQDVHKEYNIYNINDFEELMKKVK